MNFIRPNYTLVVVFLLASSIFSACDITDEVPLPVQPVVEGWISSDGYPVVQFTQSIVPDEDDTSISDKIVRWGKVSISDGDRTVVLTGGMSYEYMPPYRYYTFDMKGEPGKTYTIVAEDDNLRATAQCTMPEPVEISSIDFKAVEGCDTLRAATLKFVSADDAPSYYYISIRDYTAGRRSLPAMMGTVKSLKPREDMEVALFMPKNNLDTLKYTPQFKTGQKIEVCLNHITEEVYNFWHAYDDAIMFGGSLFTSSTQHLPGNIQGGFGVWSAQGSSSRYIEVK